MHRGRITAPHQASTTGQRKPYSGSLVQRVASIYAELLALGEVVTVSEIARRAGVSRTSVRAVLKQEFGWTEEQSAAALQAGRQRGQLLQAVAGQPGLARGRRTLAAQGWPNLKQGHQTLAATGYAGLDRGRATQAAHGWPVLVHARRKQAGEGFPQLAKGRGNLAVRGWPNWTRAHLRLAEQAYLPLLEARLFTEHAASSPELDRRVLRGRTTRLAIVEALQRVAGAQGAHEADPPLDAGARKRRTRITARHIAIQLRLHPATVYKHLKVLNGVSERPITRTSSD